MKKLLGIVVLGLLKKRKNILWV